MKYKYKVYILDKIVKLIRNLYLKKLMEENIILKVFNIKDKQEYMYEVAVLTQKEWGSKTESKVEFENKVQNKIKKMKDNFNNKYYCKLILIDDNELIGFISIFPNDCKERKELFPWYSTMYVKEKYRGKGYSKILNKAILDEAKIRHLKKYI